MSLKKYIIKKTQIPITSRFLADDFLCRMLMDASMP